MKNIMLGSLIILMCGCTVSMNHSFDKENDTVIEKKEFFIGPKIGKD